MTWDNLAHSTGYSKSDAEKEFSSNVASRRDDRNQTLAKQPNLSKGKKGTKRALKEVRAKPKMLGAYVIIRHARSELRVRGIERASPETKQVVKNLIDKGTQILDPQSSELPSSAGWLQRSRFENTDTEIRDVSSEGSFIPSVALTDFWIRGLKKRLKKPSAEQTNPAILLDATSLEARREFGELIVHIISVMAYAHQHEIDDFSNFGAQGRFCYAVTDQMLNQIPILGDEGTPFFGILYRELLSYLRHNVLDGDWGSLEAIEGDFKLKPKQIQIEQLSPNWRTAKLLE